MGKNFFQSVAFLGIFMFCPIAFAAGSVFDGGNIINDGGQDSISESGYSFSSCANASLGQVFADAANLKQVAGKTPVGKVKLIWQGSEYKDSLGNIYIPAVHLVTLKTEAKKDFVAITMGECSHQVNTAQNKFWTYTEYQSTVVFPAFYPIGRLSREYINDMKPARQKAWRELNRKFGDAVGAENLDGDK
jgi:hypothetical protein